MSVVLIIDDDPEVRDLCRTILLGDGYDVFDAADAPSGVALARQQRPDLILLDWMLPGVDGIEALRILKASPKTSRIPIVMLTALDGLANVATATYAGADGYVTKPFEPGDLTSLVRRYVKPESETKPAGE